ncbi:hypothetical protein BDV29DRAFT_159247 [Aspergillus leporis]|uniref:Uncharacterized protein n=1 Tax=Aspergillus leporis TaxID=41062 RepID=A0A5N5WSX3_9EURO|nr:hypothetical protein BDV29DRAFT_159247 [Aspergillus leporis]
MRFLQTALVAAIALCTASVAAADVNFTYVSNGYGHFQVIEPRRLTALDHPGYLSAVKSTANCLARCQENPRQFHIKAGLQKLKPPRYVEKVYCNDPPTNDPPSDESPSDDPSSTLYGLFDL